MAIRKSSLTSAYTVGTTANRPAAPAEGTQYFNTTIGGLQIYLNGQWVTHQKPADIIAPSGVTATNQGTSRAFNNGQASISFTPSELGGLATNYVVTSSPGGYTNNGTSSPIVITGLQSNTSYTYTVAASNSYSSATSAASAAVTATTIPATPSAPTTINDVVNYGSAPSQTVSWSAPATGGSAIIDYTVTQVGGSSQTVAGTSATFTGLTAGTSYTYTVLLVMLMDLRLHHLHLLQLQQQQYHKHLL